MLNKPIFGLSIYQYQYQYHAYDPLVHMVCTPMLCTHMVCTPMLCTHNLMCTHMQILSCILESLHTSSPLHVHPPTLDHFDPVLVAHKTPRHVHSDSVCPSFPPRKPVELPIKTGASRRGQQALRIHSPLNGQPNTLGINAFDSSSAPVEVGRGFGLSLPTYMQAALCHVK